MKKNILAAFALLMSLTGFVSCSDDELGPTIFPVLSEELDPNSSTYPLDRFLKENYLEPYNMRFDYRMSDTEADMNYNLVPASYENSVKMAVLIKYLWYDVYDEVIQNAVSKDIPNADKFFLKRYGPKMIMLIGSPAYNASTGTKVQGLAESGVKISLFDVNSLDINDFELMNENFFRVMHHEFSHVLNQNVAFSDDFKETSSGLYDPMNWQDKQNEVVRSQGFITPYASSEYNEDFVETIAFYVVSTDEQWASFLDQASKDYEEIEVSAVRPNSTTPSEYEVALSDSTFIRIISTISDVFGNPSSHKILRVSVQREGSEELSAPLRDEEGNLIYRTDLDNVDGKAIIEQKLSEVKEYLYSGFGIDIDALRHEVLSRTYLTDDNGDFVIDNGKYINRLTYPIKSDPTKTLIDSLVYQVDQYKVNK